MRRASERSAEIAVAAVWFLATAAAVGWVLCVGSSVPYQDDVDFVPAMVGAKEVTWSWLARGYNDHRFPLVRALGVLLLPLFDSDFRVGALIGVVAMSAAALASMIALRRARGRTSLCDAALPLIWLHWGHYDNWRNSLQMIVTLPSALVGLLLAAAIAWSPGRERRYACVAAACAVLLPMTGGAGLVSCAAFALWSIAVVGWTRAEEHRLHTRLAGVGVLSIGAYFAGYARSGEFESVSATLLDRASLALRNLAGCFGVAGDELWPWSGLAAAALAVSAAVVSLHALRSHPHERLRAGAPLVGILASLSIAVAIGVSRGSVSAGTNLPPHYVTQMAPLAAAVYCAWRLYGEGWIARTMVVAQLVLHATLFVPNLAAGYAAGKEQAHRTREFMADVRAGLSSPALSAKYASFLHPDPRLLARTLGAMRAAGIGPFDGASADARIDRDRVGPFESLATQPSFGRPAHRIVEVPLARRPVVVVPRGGELVFDLPRCVRRVRAGFGLFPGGHRMPGSEGARFVVELRDGCSVQPLYERYLDPLRLRADRGTHLIELQLPPGARGELALRVLAPSESTARGGRTYWRDVVFD